MRYMFFFVIAVSSSALAQNVTTLWKARGIEAQEKLKSLKANLTSQQKCEKILEEGFSLHANPDLAKTMEFSIAGRKAFNLRMKAENKTAIIGFIYLADEQEVVSIEPMFVDKASVGSWGISIFPSQPSGSFVLHNGMCTYNFLPKDFMHPDVKVNDSK